MSEKTEKRKKLVFVKTEEEKGYPEEIREKMKGKKLVDFDLWVRTPDSEKLDELQLAARLCSCDTVCLAVIEDEL
jgi:hypothetical protein